MSEYESARSKIMDLGMTLARKDGEFRVNWRGGTESTAYYTNDLADALATAECMSIVDTGKPILPVKHADP